MNEFPIPIEDLERLRSGLNVVSNYLQGIDISNAMKNLSPETVWSPLTEEVGDLLDRVQGHLKEYAFAQYDEDNLVPLPDDIHEIDMTADA